MHVRGVGRLPSTLTQREDGATPGEGRGDAREDEGDLGGGPAPGGRRPGGGEGI